MNQENSPPRSSAAMPVPPAVRIPAYLSRSYSWAYLNPRNLRWLDRSVVVSAILFCNARKLMRAAVAEFSAASKVLQAACVYGEFSSLLARKIGAQGQLDIVDVAPIQVENARRKLADQAQVQVRLGDLSAPDIGVAPGSIDAVCCFFLLHEVPDPERRAIVANLLAAVRVGGKVVFADYHQPRWWHPLGPLMALVFATLEPYAGSLLRPDISSLAPQAADFSWHKTTVFGALYQQVVATRLR